MTKEEIEQAQKEYAEKKAQWKSSKPSDYKNGRRVADAVQGRRAKKIDLNDGRMAYHNNRMSEHQFSGENVPKAMALQSNMKLNDKVEVERMKADPNYTPASMQSEGLMHHKYYGNEAVLGEEDPEPEAKPQQQAPQQRRQQAPVKREKAPIIDFGRLAARGYMSEDMTERPGENIPDPTQQEQPKVRLGKDLLYSKARERSASELAEQAPIKEPQQKEPAKQSYDDMWASASDEDKAAFAEFMAQRNQKQ